jgi:predicted metalloprotease with PDZ domain
MVPVTISFSLSSLSTTFTMSPVGGWYDPIEVRGFTATDSKGTLLSVRYYQDSSNKQTWTINTAGVNNLTVRYSVYLRYFDPKTGNGGAYLGYVGPTFLLSGAGWVFLHPEGYTGDFQAFFDLPDGWTVAVPWNKAGSGYVWTIGSDSLAFARSVVGLGTFQKSTMSIAGSNLTVAIHTSFSTADSQRILEFTSRGFQYVANLFGAMPPTSYVSVWVPKPNKNRIDFIETYNSAGEAIDGFGMTMMYSFLHRFVHTFNAFMPTGMGMRSDAERWFSEGCNVYYDSKIPYVLGYENDLNWLIDYFQEYRSYYGTSYDGPVTTTEPFSDRILTVVYGKASLVCFVLDNVIMWTTNGAKSLSDVMRRMYQRYGNFHGYYSTDGIQDMMSQISGFDLTRFFKFYVWGTSELPVSLSGPLGIAVDWDQMQSDLGPIPGQTATISRQTTYALTDITAIQTAQIARSTTSPITPATTQSLSQTTTTSIPSLTSTSPESPVGLAALSAAILLLVTIVVARTRKKRHGPEP